MYCALQGHGNRPTCCGSSRHSTPPTRQLCGHRSPHWRSCWRSRREALPHRHLRRRCTPATTACTSSASRCRSPVRTGCRRWRRPGWSSNDQFRRVARHHARRTAVAVAPARAMGGLLADRMSKRNILIVTATAAMIPSILLGVLTLSHHINVGGPRPRAHRWTDRRAGQACAPILPERNGVRSAPGERGHVQQHHPGHREGFRRNPDRRSRTPLPFFLNALSFTAVIAGLLSMRPGELSVPDPVARGAGDCASRTGLRSQHPQTLCPPCLFSASVTTSNSFSRYWDAKLGARAPSEYLLGALGAGPVIGGLALAGVLARPIGRIVGAALLLAISSRPVRHPTS